MLTLAEYIINRLSQLGITECFGVPGDFSLPICRTIANHKIMRWIGCSNELNAAYAADGYARIKGAGLLCTTYGVGELSALNGVMGSKAEFVPVFHLVGMPTTQQQIKHSIVHHTLGDGVYHNFSQLSASAACVMSVLDPNNVIYEMERVISFVKEKSQPAYLLVPMDLTLAPVHHSHFAMEPHSTPGSNLKELKTAIEKISKLFDKNQQVVIMPSFKIARMKLEKEVQKVIEKSGCPFVSMPMDKAVISEDHPQFAGMYNGDHSQPLPRELVNNADWILNLGGSFLNEFNTCAYDYKWSEEKIVTVDLNYVKIGKQVIYPVMIKDVLDGIFDAINSPTTKYKSPVREKIPIKGKVDDNISVDSLYSRFANFIREGDIIIVDVGSLGGIASLPFPKNTTYYSQSMWSSIGFATPCGFGTSLASPERRTVIFTGDGAHQMTASELGNMSRYGAKVILFVLNNDGYMIERVLDKFPNEIYNDIAQWEYSKLPHVFGCKDWFTAKVTSNAEFDEAMKNVEKHNGSSYIEIVSGKLDISNGLKLFSSRAYELYN